ncbi:hypothetical protein [Streptomyces sp. NPDC048825]|uniref:hypothetical protein n=1 Tax=Streptomyces sp. NPDC048825 TaxID=3365592 RepID=UPI003715E736
MCIACRAAAADVDGDGVACAEGVLEEPFGFGRPVLLAVLPLLLAACLLGDPPPGALEVLLLYAFEEAQLLESGRRTTVHVFDSRLYGSPCIWKEAACVTA